LIAKRSKIKKFSAVFQYISNRRKYKLKFNIEGAIDSLKYFTHDEENNSEFPGWFLKTWCLKKCI
jgi:hypothetical protein